MASIFPRDFLEAIHYFYSTGDAPKHIYEQAKRVTEMIKEIDPGKFRGAALVGFPSYIGLERLEEPPQEPLRYQSIIKERIPQNYSNPCPSCKIYGDPHLMLTACKECKLSLFKPRTMRSVKQDIDMILVHEGDNAYLEKVKEALVEKKFVPSWYDMQNALNRIAASCYDPEIPLPLELHAMSYEAFCNWNLSYRPGELYSYKIDLKSIDLNSQKQPILKNDQFMYGPITVGTILWVDAHHKIEEVVIDSVRKTIDWLENKRLPNESLEETLLKYARETSSFFTRFTNQPYYYRRMLDQMKKNLFLA